jgi:hypothetical protein
MNNSRSKCTDSSGLWSILREGEAWREVLFEEYHRRKQIDHQYLGSSESSTGRRPSRSRVQRVSYAEKRYIPHLRAKGGKYNECEVQHCIESQRLIVVPPSDGGDQICTALVYRQANHITFIDILELSRWSVKNLI